VVHPQYLNTHSVTDSPLREYISVSQKTYAFLFFLYCFMRYIVIVLVIVGLASCASGRSGRVPHGCGKASKKYYHGEFLEYR